LAKKPQANFVKKEEVIPVPIKSTEKPKEDSDKMVVKTEEEKKKEKIGYDELLGNE
jgi:hypothetical protein